MYKLHFKKRKFGNQQGQSVVELALLLPILLLLLFGILEFGRVYSASMMIHNGARDGARVGAVGGNDSAITLAIENTTGVLNQEDITVAINRSGTGNRGDVITVTVGYDVTIIAPFIGSIVGNPLHLESSMSMRIE